MPTAQSVAIGYDTTAPLSNVKDDAPNNNKVALNTSYTFSNDDNVTTTPTMSNITFPFTSSAVIQPNKIIVHNAQS